MAGGAKIGITITGKGGHCAFPHLGTDPIVIASHVVCALQTIVARTIDPVESGVVSIGHMNGVGAANVIPDAAHMQGTARWYNPSVGKQIEDKIHRLATGIAESFGARADVVFHHVCPPTINDPDATALTQRAAAAVAGEARVSPMLHPVMSGEDFAFMLNAKQGSYILLGGGRGQNDPTPISPTTISTTKSCQLEHRIGQRLQSNCWRKGITGSSLATYRVREIELGSLVDETTDVEEYCLRRGALGRNGRNGSNTSRVAIERSEFIALEVCSAPIADV